MSPILTEIVELSSFRGHFYHQLTLIVSGEIQRPSDRLGISVSMPEGAIGFIRDHGNKFCSTGSEMIKYFSTPMGILMSALVRGGRCTKMLRLELGTTLAPFVIKYHVLI